MTAKALLAGRFENTRVYVHRKAVKQGRQVDGRYIRVGGVFKLGSPPLKSLQFIGVHDCMFMTISYPDYVRGVLDLAADLPSHPDGGIFTWAANVKCKVLKKDLWYFIPTSTWGFLEGEYDMMIKTVSTLSILRGSGGGMYYLLNMPLLTRKYLRARYKNLPAVKENK
jgi:hypothetical protein